VPLYCKGAITGSVISRLVGDNGCSEGASAIPLEHPIWAGFGLTLLALFSYPLFARFPITRDFPWANLLLFLFAGGLLALGLKRAFRESELYRGKVSGSILGGLSVILFGLFCYGIFYVAKDIPSADRALRRGQTAPDLVSMARTAGLSLYRIS